MRKTNVTILLVFALSANAQLPDHTYKPNIASVKLFRYGDMYSYPILKLNSNDQLQLLFDDLDADAKTYYYTYQLCNADWSPSSLQPYDYIRGFQTTRISAYRYSSIAFTHYTNYQAVIPDPNCVPTRSGNYLLKVFLNSDTSKLAFTKRFLVIDNKVSISAQLLQPFNGQLYRTHQRVQVGITTNSEVRSVSPQDLKVVILQNNIWTTALFSDRPTIFRGNYYEYSDEATTTFEGGKEWRWIDLRSLRLMSDRMQRMTDSGKSVHVFVKPDGDRENQTYLYYNDLDGIYTIESTDNTNPYWQGDYAYVHFIFIPPGQRAFEGRSVYLFGELTNYSVDQSSRMIFNPDKGAYEKTLFLKQGYYNYCYVTMTDRSSEGRNISFENTEGNYSGTENTYTVLVYFRPFGARADELIGYATANSVLQGQ
ncbi:MAG TPA: DUF5103 domain-containing protein [Chitinophagaceae bacterium]|nr:DUF5103 domain-containing protein [Chitinophagaceae bacterium]